jgi:hypothetical protein
MVLALPLRAEPGGPEIGAICLMFDRHIISRASSLPASPAWRNLSASASA